jgi:hypothetical protein
MAGHEMDADLTPPQPHPNPPATARDYRSTEMLVEFNKSKALAAHLEGGGKEKVNDPAKSNAALINVTE